MEKRCRIDQETSIDQESGNENVRQTSKLLEELFKAHSRHPEFIRAVVWCLGIIIRNSIPSEESRNAIELGIHGLADIYATKSLWIQSQIVNEIYRSNLPELTVLLANSFRASKNGVTVPVRLLLQGRTQIGSEAESFLPSYAMALGENATFNLGLAADGPVREARKVPLEAVKKVSMSSAHTLFLTYKGEVYACGATANFDTGRESAKLVVSPIKIAFPGETLPIVDIAAGPHHSVFITPKTVYVCGINNNFCLGLKKDKGQYIMKSVKLEVAEGVKKLRLEKAFTNADCTIVRSATDMWITGKTPFKINETFTQIVRGPGVYEMITSNSKLIGLSNELAVVYFTTVPWVFPVNVIRVDYKKRGLKDLEVMITNNCGVLSYTFDPRPSRTPIEACVASVNGVLVELCCVDYHLTLKGDIMVMGYPGTSRAMEYCSLFHGYLKVIEDKTVDDGFTEAYSTETKVTGLRVLLVLQEVHGAYAVSSFARSPDGKNLIYVTNSCTSCRNVQWETADYAKLNVERELSCLDKVDLDFHIFDSAGTRTDTLKCAVRARFPNVDQYTREPGSLWIEDLANKIPNAKCAHLFRNYLVLNENRVINRGSTTKAIMDEVCHILGVQCIRHDRFYQLGEPLNSLDDLVANCNCVLISDEGREIEFVRELLELQSSYFGVAITYQSKEEIPRFRLCGSEKVIKWALLSILNPNFLRTLKEAEIVELLLFLDQYLLYAVTADAVRVIFERVNEFNMSVIFDLYETMPQLRPLIAEHFSTNLFLLAFWKNSAAAPLDLILDAFACVEMGSVVLPDSANCPPFFLEPPKIEILDCYRKAHWGLFRTEDAFDVLLGEGSHDSIFEHALLKYLSEYIVLEGGEEESFESAPTQFYGQDSLEPELVTTIRARLEEREQAKLRRARKKSLKKSGSEEVSRPVPCPQVEQSHRVVDEEYAESLLSGEEKGETKKDEGDLSPFANDLDATLDLGELNEELQFQRRSQSSSGLLHPTAEEQECEVVSSAKAAWKTPEPPSVATSPVNESQDTPVLSKKKALGRFAPKGTKFRDASNLLTANLQGTHIAPWANVTSSPKSPDSVPLSAILQEQESITKQVKLRTPLVKTEDSRQQRRRTSGSVTWSEALLPQSSPATSPPTPSLAEIMKEEERLQREGTKRVSRPLQFIEDEERAIVELTQLYRENIGDEVVVRVERCASSADSTTRCPVWMNTPHFRA